MRAVHALGAPGELQSEFFLAALYRHDFPLNQVDEQIVFLTRIVEIPFVVRFPAYLRYVLLFFMHRSLLHFVRVLLTSLTCSPLHLEHGRGRG